MTKQEFAEVIKAWADGKPVQHQRQASSRWEDCDEDSWSYAMCDDGTVLYCESEIVRLRIKPEPRAWWEVRHGDLTKNDSPITEDLELARSWARESRGVIFHVREVLDDE